MLLISNNQNREYNSHQRAGLITLLLRGGSKLTTEHIARLAGMSWQGAEKMMCMLSAAIPIIKVDGEWQWMVEE